METAPETEPRQEQKTENQTLTHSHSVSVQVTKARQALADNMIQHNIQLGCFTVKAREGTPQAVQLFPKETCTCPSTSTCYHILACRMSLGMKVEDNQRTVNLTRLRSNARKRPEKKCGRKRLRPGDILPAPDSVTSRIQFQTTSSTIPDETTSSTIPDKTTSSTIPDETTSSTIPDETNSSTIPDKTTSSTIPDVTINLLECSEKKGETNAMYGNYLCIRVELIQGTILWGIVIIILTYVILFINKYVATPDDSHLWIEEFHLTLASRDDILEGKRLDDTVIRGGQLLMKKMYPAQNGLRDSVVLEATNRWNSEPQKFVQIIFDRQRLHWVCISNKISENDVVEIFDTAPHRAVGYYITYAKADCWHNEVYRQFN